MYSGYQHLEPLQFSFPPPLLSSPNATPPPPSAFAPKGARGGGDHIPLQGKGGFLRVEV